MKYEMRCCIGTYFVFVVHVVSGILQVLGLQLEFQHLRDTCGWVQFI